jgi:hypothetical protein
LATIYKISGKNSGKDVSVTISDNLGNQWNAAQIGIMTHFEISSDYAHSETKSIINGGQVFHETLPHGAKCKIKFSRYSAALEDMENSYRVNSQNGKQVVYQIQYQVQNRNTPVTTRKLVDCKPLNFSLGSFDPDKDVEQGVEFVSVDLLRG